MSHEWQKRTAEVALLNFDAWLMRQAAEEQLDERWTKPMAIRHTREQKAAWRIVDEDRTAALRQKEAVRIMSTPYVMSLFMVPDSDSEEEEEEAAAEPQHNDHADQPEAAAAPASYSLQHAEEEPEPEVEGSALDDALHQMQLGIMACSSRIRSRDYWLSLLDSKLQQRLTIGGSVPIDAAANAPSLDASSMQALRAHLLQRGWMASAAVPAIQAIDTELLLSTIRALKARGWPPVFAFVFDEFWSVFASIWQLMATVLDDANVELEPSFFVYALEAPGSTPAVHGKRFTYLGGNFGLPHRDHSHTEANDEHGNPKIVSVWIPVTDATIENGCMYVVDKEDDANFDKPETYAHMRSALREPDHFERTPPGEPTPFSTRLRFDLSAARPLIVPAASTCAWFGNLIHWGSRCTRYAHTPRVSITCTFRRKDARPTHLQGEMGSLKRSEISHLGLDQRLQLIAKSLLLYSWWYGLPDSAVPPEFFEE